MQPSSAPVKRAKDLSETIREPVQGSRAPRKARPGDNVAAQKAVAREMSTLNRQRHTLPPPEETQLFVLRPEHLSADRSQALTSLYDSNRAFRAIVDEMRANRMHYLNQLQSGAQ